jgi:hypothetical protein
MIEMIERNKCVITGRADLEYLYTFKNFPVYMGCTDEPIDKDLKTDMIWCIGRSSGMIQLKKLVPLEVLYQKSHGAGEIGLLSHKFHKEFAHFIMESYPPPVMFLK